MDRTEQIDRMLKAWHHYNNPPADLELGFPDECPSCRGYQSSKQWHGTDVNAQGVVYARAPDPFVANVGAMVERATMALPNLQRIALAYQARVLVTGNTVRKHPRLPVGEALIDLIADARVALFSTLNL